MYTHITAGEISDYVCTDDSLEKKESLYRAPQDRIHTELAIQPVETGENTLFKHIESNV